MRSIGLKVQNNELIATGDLTGIVAGETPYVQFNITTADMSWYSATIALVFEWDKKQKVVQASTSGIALMPEEVSNERYFHMRVIGLLPNGTRYVTKNRLLVEQEEV